jgi:hypothetical protein
MHILKIVFLDGKLRDKILHQMIKSIPWLQSALNFKMIASLICWAVSRDGRTDTEQVEPASLAR